MNQQQEEEELRRLLGAPAGVPEARLRRVREVVFTRIAQADAPRWLRWQTALPAAASLLLLGCVAGWNVGGRLADSQDLDLIGTVLMTVPGGVE
jgi:hypothetical protein